MTEEIALVPNYEEENLAEGKNPLEHLEEKISYFIKKYQELKKERDELIFALKAEKEKVIQLEKKLDLLSQDREKVKLRLDQLLYRLKSVDL